jgi:large subunit ribosomal protein L25
MADIVLEVEVRERTGKGGSREARRAGLVPGILYGGPLGPVNITLNARQLNKALNSGKLIAHLLEIDHKGKKQTVLAQAIQFNPVTDQAEHVDLYRVEPGQIIKVPVHVEFTGEGLSPGIKRGGALNIVRHEVQLYCPSDKIPEVLVFDVSAMEIGDAIKISAITLPEGVTPVIKDRDFTIATIAGRGAKDEAEDKAEAAAGAAAGEAAAAAGAPAAGAAAAGGKAPAAGAKAAPAAAPAAKAAPKKK